MISGADFERFWKDIGFPERDEDGKLTSLIAGFILASVVVTVSVVM
jgi:hypothetical protein